MSLKSLSTIHAITATPRTESVGDAGGIAYTEGTSRTILGRIQPASSAERDYARQRGSDVTHVIYFSSDPSLNTDHKLTYGGRDFEIEGKPINVDELGRLWKVYATEMTQRNN